MYDAGGTFAQRLVAKYTLAGVPRDPATMSMAAMGTGLKVAGMAAGAVGTGISASATLAAGEAEADYDKFAGETSLNAATLAAAAARNSSELTAKGQEFSGQLAETEAKFTSDQLTRNASTARAEGQRQAFDLGTQTRLALSTLQARASGGGLSATGATPLAIAGSIGSRGAYLALGAMANGENTARSLEDQAYAATLSGKAAKYGADVAAAGTRYAGEAEAVADLYKGQSEYTAGQLKANAALKSSSLKADATIASGIGSSLSNLGAIMYPTPTGKAGVSVG